MVGRISRRRPDRGSACQRPRGAESCRDSGTAADTPTLQSILTLFQQALQQKPNSAEAHFGVALCLAGLAGNDLDGGPTPAELSNSSNGSAGGPNTGTVSTGVVPPGSTSGPSGIASTISPPNSGSGGGSGPALPTPPTTGDVPPAPPGHSLPISPLPPRHQLALLWNIDSSLANPYALLNMLAPVGSLQYGLIPFYGYSQDGSDVARRQKLLSTLDTVEQNLQAVEAIPDFSTTLPDPNRQGQMVAVGLPEVYLFDAYVNSLRTEVALSLAYVRDPGNEYLVPPPVPLATTAGAPQPPIFAAGSGGGSGVSAGGTAIISPTSPVNPYVALDKNHDGKLTPDEYLPPSPYLTLRDPALLTTAQQAMKAVADLETKGIAEVLARPADAVFLVSNTQEVQQKLTEVRDHVVPLIQQAASGPVTIEIPLYLPVAVGTATAVPPTPAPASDQGGVFAIAPQPSGGAGTPIALPTITTEKVMVNLAAWFAQPPPDLKAFAPTYTLNRTATPIHAHKVPRSDIRRPLSGRPAKGFGVLRGWRGASRSPSQVRRGGRGVRLGESAKSAGKCAR